MEKNLWTKVKEGLGQALEKSEELTKLSSKKMEIAGLHYKIEKTFTDLGAYVYNYSVEKRKKNIIDDDEFKEKLEIIKKLHKSLEAKEKEVKKI